MSKLCKEVNGKVMISTAAAVELFGITRRTLTNWEKDGLEKDARGWWDLEKLIRFRGLGNASNVTGTEKSLTERKLIAEVNYKEAQGELTRIKNDITMGKYLESYYVEEELKRFFVVLKRTCLSIPRKISGKLATMIDPGEARKLENECNEIITDALMEMSVGGVFNAKKV